MTQRNPFLGLHSANENILSEFKKKNTSLKWKLSLSLMVTAVLTSTSQSMQYYFYDSYVHLLNGIEKTNHFPKLINIIDICVKFMNIQLSNIVY